MMTELTIPERVAKGVSLLDRLDPSLLTAVDIEKLDMRSACRCILGQIGHKIVASSPWGENSYFAFVSNVNVETKLKDEKYDILIMDEDEAGEHGFTINFREAPNLSREWDDLVEEWKKQLRMRDSHGCDVCGEDGSLRYARGVEVGFFCHGDWIEYLRSSLKAASQEYERRKLDCGHQPTELNYRELDDRLVCSPCHHSKLISNILVDPGVAITTLIYDGEGPFTVIATSEGEFVVIDYDGEEVEDASEMKRPIIEMSLQLLGLVK